MAGLAHPGADLVRLGVDLVEELHVGLLGPDQVLLHPGDGVLELPGLQLGRQPVPGRVVGGGVRAHPVGEGLDQRRALPLAGGLQGLAGHGQAGQHVVAVHPDAGEAEAVRAQVQRLAALPLQRLGDGPLVVLAEEHHRGVVHRGPDERLVHVALAGRAVAEVGDHGLAVLAHRAVALDAHGVAGGVQRLAADHDRVQVEVVRAGIPAAVADPAVQAEQQRGVQAAAPGHAVLPVGGEGHVARPQGPARAHLRCLLAQQRGPDAQLALALERDGLEVDPADDDQVPVEGLDLLAGDLQRIAGMLDPLTLGGEELD